MHAHHRRVFIGIGGGSASGKTTLAGRLTRALTPLRVRVVHLDHFYLRGTGMPTYRSARERRQLPDWNHPGAFDWNAVARAVRRARRCDVLILEGILALHPPTLRRRMTLCLYVDCPAPMRLERRLARGVPGWSDRRHRIFWRECVLPGHRRFVSPTRRCADAVLSATRPNLRRIVRLVRAITAAGP